MNYQVIAAIGSFLAATMAVIATFLAWRATKLQLKTNNMSQVFEFQRLIVNESSKPEFLNIRMISNEDLQIYGINSEEIKQYELILLSIWAGHFAYGRYRKLFPIFPWQKAKSFPDLVQLVNKKGCVIPKTEYSGRIVRNSDFIYRWPLLRRMWSYGCRGITAAVVHATIEQHFEENSSIKKEMFEKWEKIGVQWLSKEIWPNSIT